MKGLQFEIRQPNGTVEVVLVDGDSARIGNAGHCEIRLPIDQASTEHLAIERVGDELKAMILAQPAPTIEGVPMQSGPLAQGATIAFNAMRVTVTALGSNLGNKEEKKKRWVLYAAGAVTALAACGVLFIPTEEAAPQREPDVHLFADPSQKCPYANVDEARAFAFDQLAIADARAERHPFVPRDGVAAVGQYDVAAICFRAAGNGEMAGVATAAGNTLRESVLADFRARSLRLEYSLRAEDGALAMADIIVLRTLTEDRKGPYYEWLGDIARQLKQGEEKQ